MGAQTSRHWECEPPVPTITLNDCDMSGNLDPRHAAALSVRAKKTASRIAAAKMMAEMRDRRQADQMATHSAKSEQKQRKTAEETEAQKLRRKRIAAEMDERERKALESKVENAAREERRRRDEQTADEKRRRRHMEGVAWGFDDRAGKRRGSGLSSKASASSTKNGCYVSDGLIDDGDGAAAAADKELHEVDDIGRRTGRRWHRGNTWGVEAGGPGKEVVFEFGGMRDLQKERQKERKSGSWSRRGRL